MKPMRNNPVFILVTSRFFQIFNHPLSIFKRPLIRDEHSFLLRPLKIQQAKKMQGMHLRIKQKYTSGRALDQMFVCYDKNLHWWPFKAPIQ